MYMVHHANDAHARPSTQPTSPQKKRKIAESSSADGKGYRPASSSSVPSSIKSAFAALDLDDMVVRFLHRAGIESPQELAQAGMPNGGSRALIDAITEFSASHSQYTQLEARCELRKIISAIKLDRAMLGTGPRPL